MVALAYPFVILSSYAPLVAFEGVTVTITVASPLRGMLVTPDADISRFVRGYPTVYSSSLDSLVPLTAFTLKVSPILAVLATVITLP